MTDHERREITVKLVELGFRGTVEPGDPAGDYRDAKTLHDRVGVKLAGDASGSHLARRAHLTAHPR